jgi:hypothetical protein
MITSYRPYKSFPNRSSWWKKACRGKFQFAKHWSRNKQLRLMEFRKAQKRLAKKDRKVMTAVDLVKGLFAPKVRNAI